MEGGCGVMASDVVAELFGVLSGVIVLGFIDAEGASYGWFSR